MEMIQLLSKKLREKHHTCIVSRNSLLTPLACSLFLDFPEASGTHRHPGSDIIGIMTIVDMERFQGVIHPSIHFCVHEILRHKQNMIKQTNNHTHLNCKHAYCPIQGVFPKLGNLSGGEVSFPFISLCI